MPDARRFLTADERLKELQRDRKALRRERMIREVAGPVWHRMVRVIPLSFPGQGRLVARVLLASREAVIEALRSDAVFAVDTAMRLAHGVGFLACQEVQAYLTGTEPLDRLAAAGLISADDYFDITLVRPWPGPTRLLACLVDELPPSRVVKGGYRAVAAERLGRELVGAVGPRADLFVLYEKIERVEASASLPSPREISMLGNKDATATAAVKDLGTARRFYEDKLGLQPAHPEDHGVITYKTGGSSLVVYASQFAGTNKATTVTWSVGGDFDEIMKSLQAKGVAFEHYDDLPGLTREGDVHRGGDFKLAWFKDPDGNIHHLIST